MFIVVQSTFRTGMGILFKLFMIETIRSLSNPQRERIVYQKDFFTRYCALAIIIIKIVDGKRVNNIFILQLACTTHVRTWLRYYRSTTTARLPVPVVELKEILNASR